MQAVFNLKPKNTALLVKRYIHDIQIRSKRTRGKAKFIKSLFSNFKRI